MASPGPHDLHIYQGDDFSKFFRYKAGGVYVNLTGWTGHAQMRDAPGGALLGTFTVVIADQGVALGGFFVEMDDAQTAALVPTTIAVWDLELVNPAGFKRTYLKGAVEVEEDISE